MRHFGILFLFALIAVSSTAQIQIGADIDGEAAGDNCGESVSMSCDGKIVAIGASQNDVNGFGTGHVRVFKNTNNVWTQIGVDIDGKAAHECMGQSVSISCDGSIVAIGSDSDTGKVRVYKDISGVWTQMGNDIIGDTAGDDFGWSVSLSRDGGIVAIGAPAASAWKSKPGYVKVYKFVSGSWVQLGSSIIGEAEIDLSGFSVSLSADGDFVAIGASLNDGNGNDAGHARVFNFKNGTWVQVGKDIDGEAADDRSGYCVAISKDGSKLAIGAPNNSGVGTYSGHVRIFKYVSGAWTQMGNDIDGEAAGDFNGFYISFSGDGNFVAIGAPGNDDHGDFSGQIRLYKFINGKWLQVGSDINGEAAQDQSGRAVSIASDSLVVAIGAEINGGNGRYAGHVRIYRIGDLTSIYRLNSESYIQLYPNPSNKHCMIKINPDWIGTSYTIMNVFGTVLMTGNLNSETTCLNMEELPSGTYYLKLSNLNFIPVRIMKL